LFEATDFFLFLFLFVFFIEKQYGPSIFGGLLLYIHTTQLFCVCVVAVVVCGVVRYVAGVFYFFGFGVLYGTVHLLIDG